jgi:ABC-type glycerol-3-phosphate transport system permease component
MAAALVMVGPILLLFFVTQRYFIQGVVVSGVKG